MNEKGFDADITFNETPSFKVTEEKPLKSENNRAKKLISMFLKLELKKSKIKKIEKYFYFCFLFSNS